MTTMSETLEVILSATDKSAAAFNGLNKNLKNLESMALHVGASLLSAFAIRDVIQTTEQWGESIAKVQAVTGLTAQQASRLSVVAKAMGLDTDELALSLDKLAKNLFSNSVEADKGKDAFAKYGIATHDAHGRIRNINDVLVDAADKVKVFGNGAQATALEMDLFGKSGGRMHDLLLLGADGVKKLQEESDKLGLTLDQGGLASIREFTVQSRMLDAAMDGLKVRLGVALLPVLRDIVEWATRLIERFSGSAETGRSLAGIVKVLGEVFGRALGVLKDFAQWLGDIWTKLKGILGSVGAASLAADLLIIALAGIAGGPVLAAAAAVGLAIGSIGDVIHEVSDHWEEWRRAAHAGLLENQGLIGLTIQRLVEWGDAFNNLGTFMNQKWQEIRTAFLNAWVTLETRVLNWFHDVKSSDAWTFIASAFGVIGEAIDSAIKLLDSFLKRFDLLGALQGIWNGIFGGGTSGSSAPPGSGGGAPPAGPSGGGIPPGASAAEQRSADQCNSTGTHRWNWGSHSCDLIGGNAGGAGSGGQGTGSVKEPRFGSGGIAWGPMHAIVGESGPEAIIPLGRGGGIGTTINVYVSGNIAASEQELAERIAARVGSVIVGGTLSQRGLAY